MKVRINDIPIKSISLLNAAKNFFEEMMRLEDVRVAEKLPAGHWISNFNYSNFNINFGVRQEMLVKRANELLRVYEDKFNTKLHRGRMKIEVFWHKKWHKITIHFKEKPSSKIGADGKTARTTLVEIE